GKEMGRHTRGRTPPRRHRRARRVQTCHTAVPRRVRRLLRNRSPDKKRVGKEVDRTNSREGWPSDRSPGVTENVRQNEMTPDPVLCRRVNGAGGKQCDMDKRSAAERRGVGTSSQKTGNASDRGWTERL